MRRALASALSRFARGRSASVTVVSALFGACLVASLALSVDVANVYLTRRDDQSALDLAALAAARDLTRAEDAARQALAQNRIPAPQSLKVTLGRYVAERGTSRTARFVANGTPTNAVRLEMTNVAKIYFGRAILGGAPKLRTDSTAVNTRMAAISIGSRLASLDGGVANALLSRLLGGSVSLSVMDYQALAAAQVDLPTALRAVASRARLTAVSYDDVLRAQPTLGPLSLALGDALSSAPIAKAALGRIAAAAASKPVALGKMVSFGTLGRLELGRSPGLSASASALDALMAGLMVANGGSQIDLDLGAQVPGVLGVTASLIVGERPQDSPWFALGPEGVTVRTAQTRLRLQTKVGGALGLASLSLPVAVDLAAAEAKLTSASCGRVPRAEQQATLAVTPAVARVWIGEPTNEARWSDLTRPADVGPAKIADTLLLTATASAYVGVENLSPTSVVFSASEIEAGARKTVATSSIGQSTLGSLTKNLTIGVELKLLGLSLGTPKFVGDTLGKTLAPVGALLDPALNALLGLLGVGLGEADVWTKGLRCDGSALVG